MLFGVIFTVLVYVWYVFVPIGQEENFQGKIFY